MIFHTVSDNLLLILRYFWTMNYLSNCTIGFYFVLDIYINFVCASSFFLFIFSLICDSIKSLMAAQSNTLTQQSINKDYHQAQEHQELIDTISTITNDHLIETNALCLYIITVEEISQQNVHPYSKRKYIE